MGTSLANAATTDHRRRSLVGYVRAMGDGYLVCVWGGRVRNAGQCKEEEVAGDWLTLNLLQAAGILRSLLLLNRRVSTMYGFCVLLPG